MRSDARQNRERVLAAARAEFAAHGGQVSLNAVARRAGVGPGTLYRHFPTLPDLLVAIVRDDVDALCAHGRELLGDPSPGAALRSWLRELAAHATAMRGLVATELLAAEHGTALTDCHTAIEETGGALLARAERAAGRTEPIPITDVLIAVSAMAWASEHGPPDDEGRLDRLLALVTAGLP
ncbi:AcrR family transcriptional regulator [Catenuloplanes nepalensis]|uniref:AcrR family transcriptional regulator n=1 Tax=Catenuloplanes nepalensis TaxID=587533 RepID=A0ABT9MR73_9ACTN|nr:TetR/AcrR family transcriptional regulator [Catenuloplanes nepalensis]MDP9793922.1 AcrR family transcriptional regulator [Catenuloplanes nepalensis]